MVEPTIEWEQSHMDDCWHFTVRYGDYKKTVVITKMTMMENGWTADGIAKEMLAVVYDRILSGQPISVKEFTDPQVLTYNDRLPES